MDHLALEADATGIGNQFYVPAVVPRTMADPDLDPRVERALATFNDHDIDSHMEEFAEGATFLDPVLDEPVSGEEHREYLRDVIEAFPDIRQEEERVLTAGEATAMESTFAGTHEGAIEGIPPTGNAVEVPLASVVTVSEDGIASWRDYWDQETFREQLGLTFPAVLGHVPGFVRWTVRERL